jgi:3-methyl-2-oxobutanoate hydroxymethyltransferase
MSVMAHIGMLPQTIGKIGKFKAEGTTAEMAAQLIDLAKQMINYGASSLLLEGVAAEVAQIITQNSDVPVISCGSGPYCDGQILVAPDILGLTSGPRPKFAKSYTDLNKEMLNAFQCYSNDVSKGSFPDSEHCYHMKSGEIEKLQQILKG